MLYSKYSLLIGVIIFPLTVVLQEVQDEVLAMRTTLQTKDAERVSLQNQLEAERASSENFESELTMANDEVSARDKTIADLHLKLSAMCDELASANTNVS